MMKHYAPPSRKAKSYRISPDPDPRSHYPVMCRLLALCRQLGFELSAAQLQQTCGRS